MTAIKPIPKHKINSDKKSDDIESFKLVLSENILIRKDLVINPNCQKTKSKLYASEFALMKFTLKTLSKEKALRVELERVLFDEEVYDKLRFVNMVLKDRLKRVKRAIQEDTQMIADYIELSQKTYIIKPNEVKVAEKRMIESEKAMKFLKGQFFILPQIFKPC